MFSPFGLGDTAVLCGLKNVLEARYNSKVVFIIKESHCCIMKIYGIQDYRVIKDRRFTAQDGVLKELGKLVPFPEKGKCFIAHFTFHPIGELLERQVGNRLFTMLDYYLALFGLPWDTRLDSPKNLHQVIEDNWIAVKDKLKEIEIDSNNNELKYALLIPESHSFRGINESFWGMIIDKVREKGLMPITSVTDEKYRLVGVINITGSLDELISLAMKADEIYSVRSGLCDLIWEKGEALTAIYPDVRSYYWARIKTLFPNSNIREIIAG